MVVISMGFWISKHKYQNLWEHITGLSLLAWKCTYESPGLLLRSKIQLHWFFPCCLSIFTARTPLSIKLRSPYSHDYWRIGSQWLEHTMLLYVFILNIYLSGKPLTDLCRLHLLGCSSYDKQLIWGDVLTWQIHDSKAIFFWSGEQIHYACWY